MPTRGASVLPSGSSHSPPSGAAFAVNSAVAVAVVPPWVHLTLTRTVVPARTVPDGDVADVTVAPAGSAEQVASTGVTVIRSATATESSPATGVSVTGSRPLMRLSRPSAPERCASGTTRSPSPTSRLDDDEILRVEPVEC